MKGKLINCLFVLTCLLSYYAYAQTTGDALYLRLKAIEPFKSTSDDVERLFEYTTRNDVNGVNGYRTVHYGLRRGRLTVVYSTGKCMEHGSRKGYDIDKNTVIRIDLFYFKDVPVRNFDFDLSRFERFEETDNNAVIYSDDDLGIHVTGGDGMVQSIEFSPTEKAKEEYGCGTRVPAQNRSQ